MKDEQLFNSDPERYEQYILAAVDKDATMFSAMGSVLCINAATGYSQNDFEFPLHWAIYRAIVKWKNLRLSMGKEFEEPLPDKGMETQLLLLSREAYPCIDPENIPEAIRIYTTIRDEITVEDAVTNIAGSWKQWLQIRKLQVQAADIRRRMIYNPDDIVAEISSAHQKISEAGMADEFHSPDCDLIMSGELLDIERFQFGNRLSELNRVLGGGLGRREHVIFVAPSGGGKTTIACQIAAEMAAQGNQTLFISTEQPDTELYPRIISANSKVPIPFSMIKDGGNSYKLLDEQQKSSMKACIQQIQDTLHFSNWIGTGRNVIADMEAVVKKFIDKFGTIDVLVFDWYGSALGNSIAPEMKRELYMDAAWIIKQLSEKYNMACVSTAMAGRSGENKKFISESDIAECKQLHRNADAAFGISALQDRDTGGDDDSKKTYLDAQWLNCFKARKGVGTRSRIYREFAYQRFVSTRKPGMTG